MPSKRSNLSQHSKGAKRLRIIRSQESTEERQERLDAVREHQTATRSVETSSDREEHWNT